MIESIKIIDELASQYDRLEDVPRRDQLRYAEAYHQEKQTECDMFADTMGIKVHHEMMRLVNEADDFWEAGRLFSEHMIATSNIKQAFQLAKVYLPDPDEYDESNDPRFEEELDSLPIG